MYPTRYCRQNAFVCVIILVVSLAQAAEYPSPDVLVQITARDRDDVDALRAKGIDIWQIESDRITAALRSSELAGITAEGFPVQILIEDLPGYFRELQEKQLLARQGVKPPGGLSYHNYEEIVQALNELESSGIAKVYDIGDTVGGRDIWAVKISDNPAVEEQEPEVLLMGNHHAREWISAEVPLYIAQKLVEQYPFDSTIKNLVDDRQIWIVPVVNPDGFVHTWTTDRNWRKNRRYIGFDSNLGYDIYGVDLNRNYSYMWGFDNKGSSPEPWSETYRGSGPFSEPETQAVKNLVEAHNFQLAVSYHCWTQVILYPWGYQAIPTPSDSLLSAMAQRISQLQEGVHAMQYTPYQAYHYGTDTINGGADDWLYGEHGMINITIELRPKGVPQFLLPEEEILPTCQENWPAALYMIGWDRNDFNANGIVDFQDLAVVASQWARGDCIAQGWCQGADENRNGRVATEDLAAFADHWLHENKYAEVNPLLVWIPAQSIGWRYRKGTSEPPSDWRDIDFVEDQTWLSGQTSIGFADSDDNTVLSDMRRKYSSVYLRHAFEIPTADHIPDRLVMRVYVDDGCVISINNRQEWRFHVSNEEKHYDSVSGDISHEAEWEQVELSNPRDFMQVGKNVLSIHALNEAIGSGDFSIDVELVSPQAME